MSLANINPLHIELWKSAALKRLTIQVESRKDAFRLRYELYTVRKRMEKDNHPAIESAHAVSLRATPVDASHPQGAWYVIAEPGGQSTFDSALEAAGIHAPTTPNLDFEEKA